MILLDLHQVMLSNMMAQLGAHTNIKVELNLFRHMVLNTIRSINMKFKDRYGELVIACDDKNYWRKQAFPYYKANRKKDREKSDLDWVAIFDALQMVKIELKESFPYRVIQVECAEADDIIATLVHNKPDTEKILIVSGDKDFQQLQAHIGVEQYDPVRKKTIRCANSTLFLHEHIMLGDMSDGIPNFLSPANAFVDKIRQKPISRKKLAEWLLQKPEEFCTPEMLAGYKRNQTLVDLTRIPQDIVDKVMTKYGDQAGKNRSKLLNYFIEHKLKNLTESLGDF